MKYLSFNWCFFCVYLYYMHFIIDVLRILYILMYWCYNLDMNLYRSPFAFLETVIQAITMYSMYTMQATEWTWNKRNGLCHVQNTQHYDCKFALYLKLPVKPNLCIPFDNISNEGKSSCHFRVFFIPLHKFLPENIFEGELWKKIRINISSSWINPVHFSFFYIL